MLRRLVGRLGLRLQRVGARLFEVALTRTPEVEGGTEVTRSYYAFGFNSPDGDMPPVVIFEIDDLALGHKYRCVLAPAQAWTLCTSGLEAIINQAKAFGDEQPRDYDTRKVWR